MLTMGVLRLIWKDIRSITQLPWALKILILVLGVALIVAVCYPGKEWWMTQVPMRYFTRNPARWEHPVVILVIFFFIYLVCVIDRCRKSR